MYSIRSEARNIILVWFATERSCRTGAVTLVGLLAAATRRG